MNLARLGKFVGYGSGELASSSLCCSRLCRLRAIRRSQAAGFVAAGFVGYGQFLRSQAAVFVGSGQFLRSQAASFVRWFCRSKRLHFRLWLQFRRSQMMLNHYFVPKMPQSSICLPRWHDTTTRKNNRTQGVRLYLYYLLHNFHVKQELG